MSEYEAPEGSQVAGALELTGRAQHSRPLGGGGERGPAFLPPVLSKPVCISFLQCGSGTGSLLCSDGDFGRFQSLRVTLHSASLAVNRPLHSTLGWALLALHLCTSLPLFPKPVRSWLVSTCFILGWGGWGSKTVQIQEEAVFRSVWSHGRTETQGDACGREDNPCSNPTLGERARSQGVLGN